jgi:hypothetical protein
MRLNLSAKLPYSSRDYKLKVVRRVEDMGCQQHDSTSRTSDPYLCDSMCVTESSVGNLVGRYFRDRCIRIKRARSLSAAKSMGTVRAYDPRRYIVNIFEIVKRESFIHGHRCLQSNHLRWVTLALSTKNKESGLGYKRKAPPLLYPSSKTFLSM